MNFIEVGLPGAFLIALDRKEDERGFFARSWCQDEFETHGLNSRLVQCNVSFNVRRGTLRGMHYQVAPHAEAKLVRCTMGAIYDVLLDLRPDSVTFKKWVSVELTAENRQAVFVPEGVAHGFQTLVGNSEIFYQMTEFYHPECAHGILWNDPAFAIHWPIDAPILSERDGAYPIFRG